VSGARATVRVLGLDYGNDSPAVTEPPPVITKTGGGERDEVGVARPTPTLGRASRARFYCPLRAGGAL
jgi:hypothetical protein